MLQVAILLAMVFSLLFVTPIRFFIGNKIIQSAILVSIGFILEISLIIFFFYKEKLDFKNTGLIKFISPCVLAAIIHSVISYFNGFYMYIAGISVSEMGILWENCCSQYLITDMRQVQPFRLTISFIVVLLFRILAVFLGYYFGKKKIDKNKKVFYKKS